MSAAGWAAKQSLVAQAADKTAEKALPATGDDAMLAIAALGVAGATVAATGIVIGRHREEQWRTRLLAGHSDSAADPAGQQPPEAIYAVRFSQDTI